MKKALACTALVATSALSAQAAVQITDVNRGLMGLTIPGPPVPDDTGATKSQIGGAHANLTDGSASTFQTTLAGFIGADDLAYIGIRFNSAQNDVTSIAIDLRVFIDGGWYNGGEGVEPVVQITTVSPAIVGSWGDNNFISNTDNIWTTVSSTTDYPTGVNAITSAGANAAGVFDGDTFTWTLTTPSDGVTAIRVIGDMGGSTSAGDSFLAASEVRAFAVPEPSLALLGIGGLSFFFLCRRR